MQELFLWLLALDVCLRSRNKYW